jgi:phage-related protein
VAAGKRVVVLHVLIKKTQQTPAKALLTATQRAKDAGLL